MGAGLGVAPNGSHFFAEWGVDIESARPNVVAKLTVHDWGTGKVKMVAPTGDYKEKFGFVCEDYSRSRSNTVRNFDVATTSI